MKTYLALLNLKFSTKSFLHIWIFLIFLTINLSCINKEGEDCHKNFLFQNNSADSVYFAGLTINPEDSNKCRFDMNYLVKSGELAQGTEIIRDCLEFRWDDEDTFIYYVIDPGKFTGSNYISCDSIQNLNHILKIDTSSFSKLKETEFKFIYP